jgi:hypothetical protein
VVEISEGKTGKRRREEEQDKESQEKKSNSKSRHQQTRGNPLYEGGERLSLDSLSLMIHFSFTGHVAMDDHAIHVLDTVLQLLLKLTSFDNIQLDSC